MASMRAVKITAMAAQAAITGETSALCRLTSRRAPAQAAEA